MPNIQSMLQSASHTRFCELITRCASSRPPQSAFPTQPDELYPGSALLMNDDVDDLGAELLR